MTGVFAPHCPFQGRHAANGSLYLAPPTPDPEAAPKDQNFFFTILALGGWLISSFSSVLTTSESCNKASTASAVSFNLTLGLLLEAAISACSFYKKKRKHHTSITPFLNH